jgi:hypothetical protein
MGLKQLLLVVGLFFAGICTWCYTSNVPVALNAEQEAAITGGAWEWIDTDCQDGTGGCTPYSTRPALINCPTGVSTNGLCNQPSWSTDDTANRICSTAGDWTYLPGLVCSVRDPYYCKVKFTTCSATGHCSGTVTTSGSSTATQCQN